MADYYIGDGATNGGSDTNSGSRSVAVAALLTATFPLPLVLDRVVEITAVLEDYLSYGDLGQIRPDNPRIKSDTVLTGELRTTKAGVDSEVEGAAALTGNFIVDAKFQDPLLTSTAFVLGNLGSAVFLDQPVLVVGVAVLSSLTLETFQDLTQDIFANQDGVRPSFPWLIYHENVQHYSRIVVGSTYQIGVNEPFLVDPLFQVASDAVFADFGARANRIGMVIEENGAKAIRFRDPEPGEVVYLKESRENRRWNDEMDAWEPYRTLAQRTLDGQLAFDVLDPTGIYDYYANVVGLAYSQWQYDTKRLGDFVDPVTVADDLTSLLADNFGLEVLFETDSGRKREFIRQFVGIQKLKGTDEGFRKALRVLGYVGYANNVFALPGNPRDWYERPIGYDVGPISTHFPTSQVTIHLMDLNGVRLPVIDDGIKQEVATFLTEFMLPAHVVIRAFATDYAVQSGGDIVRVSDTLTLTVI